MEFLIVRFKQQRFVFLDDAPSFWLTDEIIPIDPGPHKISLAVAGNRLQPDPLFTAQIVQLENTAVTSPCEVLFPPTT